MLIKIEKLFVNGEADYKGLDINQFSTFSQHYNYLTSSCVVETKEEIDVVNYQDVAEVTLEEYNAFAAEVAEINMTPEQKKIRDLEVLTGDLLMEIATLKMGGSF